MIKSAQWVVCTRVYMTRDVHAHDRRINEVCVCVQGFHTFTSLCVGVVVCQSSHRVLTSGIHAVRGLQGGRCVCIGMDVLQWVCTRGRV